MATLIDLVIVCPGDAQAIYGDLSKEYSAIEPNLWARLIAGYIKDRGFFVKIIDQDAIGLSHEKVAKTIKDIAPKLVCVVVMGQQPSASTQQMVAASAVTKAIAQESPDQKILMVGGHVSALPERTLKEEQTTYTCHGEGPMTVYGLLQGWELKDIPGLVWRHGKRIIVNQSASLITELDEHLHGDVWDMLAEDMKNYRSHNWQAFGNLIKRKPYASIYTSLGCPYKCSFCCINAPFDSNRYRTRNPFAVVGEIKKLYDTYGVTTIKIIDEMFVLKENHYLSIVEKLHSYGLGKYLNIWAYARVDTIKQGTLDALRKGGVQWLALGIESGSKHVRDGAKKALRNDDIIGVVRQIQGAGINVIGNYIFGLPDDDLRSMRETLALAMEGNTEFANFYSGMAYPGSRLYTDAVANKKRLPKTWAGYSQHSYDCTPLDTEHLKAQEVLAFRDEAFTKYFTNESYLNMVGRKFGAETRAHVKEMTKHTLKRRLLERA